ncbi:MAG: methylaspartate mutase subunit S [Clostridia bacterium]|nr:methylaspartate mutase subunit S [Clostridia bacterium]
MKNTVILGVIGADVHSVGNRILDYAFTEAGFNVVNLGVMVSKQEFIDAAIETAASAIIVSSLYGHGELDCRGLRGMCEEAGIGDILLYAGGNLVVGKTPFDEVQKRFLAMGFDRIYPPGTSPVRGIEDLISDLAVTRAKARA